MSQIWCVSSREPVNSGDNQVAASFSAAESLVEAENVRLRAHP